MPLMMPKAKKTDRTDFWPDRRKGKKDFEGIMKNGL